MKQTETNLFYAMNVNKKTTIQYIIVFRNLFRDAQYPKTEDKLAKHQPAVLSDS